MSGFVERLVLRYAIRERLAQRVTWMLGTAGAFGGAGKHVTICRKRRVSIGSTQLAFMSHLSPLPLAVITGRVQGKVLEGELYNFKG